MSEEYVPGLDDPSTVSREERVRRHAAYLGEILTFDDAILLLSKCQIAFDELASKVDVLEAELIRVRAAHLEAIDVAYETAREAAVHGRKISERFLKVLNHHADKSKARSVTASKAGKESIKNRVIKATPEKVDYWLKKLSPHMAERDLNSAIAKQLGVTSERVRQVRKKNPN